MTSTTHLCKFGPILELGSASYSGPSRRRARIVIFNNASRSGRRRRVFDRFQCAFPSRSKCVYSHAAAATAAEIPIEQTVDLAEVALVAKKSTPFH